VAASFISHIRMELHPEPDSPRLLADGGADGQEGEEGKEAAGLGAGRGGGAGSISPRRHCYSPHSTAITVPLAAVGAKNNPT
jgi:hypothetical protein